MSSPDFLKGEQYAGFLGGRFDYEKNILSLSMGDKILCVTFNNEDLPEDYTFITFEKELKVAPINDGTNREKEVTVDRNRFAEGIKQMVKETAFKRLQNEKELADAAWKVVGLPGLMPDIIFKEFMERLYSKDIKQGDRKTHERYVELFNEVLQYFGFKPDG